MTKINRLAWFWGILCMALLPFDFASAQGREPAIDVKVITTESIKRAQFQIDPRSFERSKGLKGELIIPEVDYEEKTIYFTLKNPEGNLVWEANLDWQNLNKNTQKFTFSKNDFYGLDGVFQLEARVYNMLRKTIATSSTNVEIDSETNNLTTTIKTRSRLDQEPEQIKLNLSLDNTEYVAESVLRVSTYQDYLSPTNLIDQKFFSLGELNIGPQTENVLVDLPPTAGNFLITAQIFDGLKNARSGSKKWELFIPGEFLSFKFFNHDLILTKDIKLIVNAGGATNTDNLGLSIKDDIRFLYDEEVKTIANGWVIDESLVVPENKPEYSFEIRVYKGDEIINKKTLTIENPYFIKKQRQDKVRDLIRSLINNDEFDFDPRIPVIEIIQFLFIAVFFVLAYLLFKKNKRF